MVLPKHNERFTPMFRWCQSKQRLKLVYSVWDPTILDRTVSTRSSRSLSGFPTWCLPRDHTPRFETLTLVEHNTRQSHGDSVHNNMNQPPPIVVQPTLKRYRSGVNSIHTVETLIVHRTKPKDISSGTLFLNSRSSHRSYIRVQFTHFFALSFTSFGGFLHNSLVNGGVCCPPVKETPSRPFVTPCTEA